MLSAERGHGRVHGASADADERGMRVQVVETEDELRCVRCGNTTSRASELVDGSGEVLARISRCDRCTGGHRERVRS